MFGCRGNHRCCEWQWRGIRHIRVKMWIGGRNFIFQQGETNVQINIKDTAVNCKNSI